MANQSIRPDDKLYRYLLDVSLREPEVLRRLREETATLPEAIMQITPEQGQFMALLVKLTGASKILELGVYTGYSSISLALALPPNGRLTACDISPEWTSVARRYWESAGVADKIDLRLGPAMETLDRLIAEGQAGTYDFAFLDADKENCDGYYERSLQLLRPGGLLLLDNVLWFGWVVDDAVNDADTVAIRALNRKILSDERVTISLIPVGDGITIALKN